MAPPTLHSTHLPHRGLLRVSGAERFAFLHGIVSNNVLRLADADIAPTAAIVYAALLSPQGKFLHDLFIMRVEESLWIDCERERLPDLLRRLTLYRLQSKVTLEALPQDYAVHAVWGGEVNLSIPEPAYGFADPRLPALGWRLVGNPADIQVWCAAHNVSETSPQTYDQLRLSLGVPDGSRDLTIDKSTIIPFGFEPLHGVDFAKGCYVGQEVTARSKHLGQHKKYLHQIQLISGEFPAFGTAIMAGEEAIGTLCSQHGTYGLAQLQVAAAQRAQAANQPLTCGAARVSASLPAWASEIFDAAAT